jgi:hypothetical protein
MSAGGPPARCSIRDRLAAFDWEAITAALDGEGWAVIPGLLNPRECGALAALYSEGGRFRTVVDMARLRLGVGEYRYFAHPLPALVSELRMQAYPRLAPLADRWMVRLRQPPSHPPTLAGFLARCAAAGQRRPTPLLLRYRAGGYNCLHQDLYGTVAFPLQMTCMLTRPGRDFSGGEFLLVEQRPRSQSRGQAIVLAQGDAVIFATRHRPVRGARGDYRATVRHGVSRVQRGERLTLGMIFHDAA